MAIKDDFIKFLSNHPSLHSDKPAPINLYANLLDAGSALDINIKALNIPYYSSGYNCTNVQYWENVIKPLYVAKFHCKKGSQPMIGGTYWNHSATINKYIEFLKQYGDTISQDSSTEIIIKKSHKGYHHRSLENIEDAVNHADKTTLHKFDYLRAMRTKPFLLLAGISGTGKSRIVKQMAFDSCPDDTELRSDPTSPGNYCLIEVKPNWHDSTELLGYESKIGGAHYQLTPFVKFLAKAMLYPDVPFFVCLDEMNLAPVEQYFAEFLSVLESRTKLPDGHIVSEPLVKAGIFANKDYEPKLQDNLFGLELKEETNADGSQRIISGKLSDEAQSVYDDLKKYGLRIPENVIVVGTVNMDETTHQFSRKVIDRAMTIEMNLPEGNPFMDFFSHGSELAYRNTPTSPSLYLATETKASDVIKALATDDTENTEWLKGEVASFLTNLNAKLDGTPFKVAYRVQNELILYFYQFYLENKTADWNDILNTACDQILMMKVLPRIEGDEELLKKPLDKLASFCEPYSNASKKIKEMTDRLGQSRFASFWP